MLTRQLGSAKRDTGYYLLSLIPRCPSVLSMNQGSFLEPENLLLFFLLLNKRSKYVDETDREP